MRFILISVLLSLVLSAQAAGPAVPAGWVIQLQGEVRLISPAGQARRLMQGDGLFSGDRIETQAGSHVQLRFSDGGLMSIRPDSELRIDEYHFNGYQDGSERAYFSLVSGGVRTITGLVGKRNKSHYRLITPMANLALRGTHYGVRICGPWDCVIGEERFQSPGLYGEVRQGALMVINGAGSKLFRAGQSFRVKGQSSAPLEELKAYPFIFDSYAAGQPADHVLVKAGLR